MVIAAGILRGLFVIAVAVKPPGRGQSLSLCFAISVCIAFKPESIWIGPNQGMSGFCRSVFTHCLAVFQMETFLGNLSWIKTSGRHSCLDWLGNVQRNDNNVSAWLVYHPTQPKQQEAKVVNSKLVWKTPELDCRPSVDRQCHCKSFNSFLFQWTLVKGQENPFLIWIVSWKNGCRKQQLLLGIQKNARIKKCLW